MEEIRKIYSEGLQEPVSIVLPYFAEDNEREFLIEYTWDEFVDVLGRHGFNELASIDTYLSQQLDSILSRLPRFDPDFPHELPVLSKQKEISDLFYLSEVVEFRHSVLSNVMWRYATFGELLKWDELSKEGKLTVREEPGVEWRRRKKIARELICKQGFHFDRKIELYRKIQEIERERFHKDFETMNGDSIRKYFQRHFKKRGEVEPKSAEDWKRYLGCK